jgi:hypothetical protein
VRGHNTGMEWIRGRVVYAALGDSMSIDDYAGGPGRGAASLLWRNRDHDFPAWAGRDLTACDPTARLALLASDGATSATGGDRPIPAVAPSRASSSEHERYAADSHGQFKSAGSGGSAARWRPTRRKPRRP